MNGSNLFALSASSLEEAFGRNIKTDFMEAAPTGVANPTVLKSYYIAILQTSKVTCFGNHVTYLESCTSNPAILSYFRYHIIPSLYTGCIDHGLRELLREKV